MQIRVRRRIKTYALTVHELLVLAVRRHNRMRTRRKVILVAVSTSTSTLIDAASVRVRTTRPVQSSSPGRGVGVALEFGLPVREKMGSGGVAR